MPPAFMNGIHLIDLLIIAAYLGVILYLGKRSSSATHSEEGFFLAGRKLGKFYQFFLNFGNRHRRERRGDTASLVYQQGASGVWLRIPDNLMNPYYWFMSTWFRRVRLMTVAELFEDRLGSPGLAKTYAIYQVIYVILSSAGATSWAARLRFAPAQAGGGLHGRGTAAGRSIPRIPAAGKAGQGRPAGGRAAGGVQRLGDLYARKQLRSYVSYIQPWMFYATFTVVVGLYLMMGGMAGTGAQRDFPRAAHRCLLGHPDPVWLFGPGWSGGAATAVPHEMMQLLGAPAPSRSAVFCCWRSCW